MTTLQKTTLVLSLSGFLLCPLGRVSAQQDDDLASSTPPAYEEPQAAEVPLQDPPAVPASTTEQSIAATQQTLLSSKTMVGVHVTNAKGEEMGTIRDIMIDPRTGQVVYAVVDSAGTFGLGKQKSFAVPWSGLNVAMNHTEIVLQLENGQFPQVPSVALNQR